MEQELNSLLRDLFGKTLETAQSAEVYDALMQLTLAKMGDRPKLSGDKKLYYVSAEFLIGKLLSCNLISLGLFEEAKATLARHGFDLASIEEEEREPSLGNGGLGRLAACFLDSIAALGLCGDGAGLCYHDGLFRQRFEANKQQELPDAWRGGQSWLRRTDVHFPVRLGEKTVLSTMYDIDIPGANGGRNTLHLFDLDTVDEGIIRDGIAFDKTDIEHNLTLFLYPDDSDEDGRLLRVYQQYFMVSCTAQLILHELTERGFSPKSLHEHAVVQINDTHPTMIIPELIRLLTQQYGLTMDEAVAEVERTCAYTNHTILAEALEKWPMRFLKQAAAPVVPIIGELDRRVRARTDDPAVQIIDGHDVVHMAHIDIHFGFSVNGVAALHTDILKKTELKPFYDLYPAKFNNKTNGITLRRWLLYCNQPLTAFLRETIGPGFERDFSGLEALLACREDAQVLDRLLSIKRENKEAFAAAMASLQGVAIDPESIYDVQVKRLHEYKRQQMNALYAIGKILDIRAGRVPARPITMIFGAKAAPAYTIAKDIIHLILCLSQIAREDPAVRPHLNIVMLENYNVTLAEKVIPACDVSEQISLASKEASGTGNMKFMANGAVTLGTLDGANVEIRDLVGEENIAVFGRHSDEVIRLYAQNAYDPKALMKNAAVARLVDFIVSDEMLAAGDRESLTRLHHEITTKDYFMALLDLEDYTRTKDALFARYENRRAWAQMMLVNIAKSGYFSSDRTIAQYNEEIWHL
ncbi:MAG: glycogen/starch/alpha-glucan family phosphorylase [Clostridiales bacterium]|nr:glycogen/starch/alpha-glucan family phosphorylase [Clostridiales bacterium]